MEGTVVNKNHNFLKLVSFVLAYVILMTVGLLSVYGINDKTSIVREVLQGTLVELVGVIITIILYVFVLRKTFTASAEYKLTYSNKNVILGIFFACPLIVFLKVNIFYNLSNIFQPIEITSWHEISEDLLTLPLCAILGPVFEEFCCRVMCISVFKSKKGKIIALIFTTFLFAICHGANFVIHLPGGLIFGIVFIVSQNIMLVIVLHMAWNTATYIVPDLSQAVSLLMPQETHGIWGSPIIAVAIFVIAFIVGVIMIVKNINKEKENTPFSTTTFVK